MSVQNWFVRKEQYAPGAVEMWSSNAGYDVGYTPSHEPLTINNSVTGSVMAISAASKNPEKAMEFLNLLNTDEYLRNLVDRGIEDVHYTTNQDGTITKTFLHIFATVYANIVSVFPVPVGITTIALSSLSSL